MIKILVASVLILISFKPSEWVLVFDTETTDDETQRFRFGTFQLWEGGRREAHGVLLDPDATTDVEKRNLETETRKLKCKLLTVADFMEKIFFPAAYKAGATIVGFNLPFDLSRLALAWQRARPVYRRNRNNEVLRIDRSMVSGFTFKVSDRVDRPNLRVKHLSRRAAFINFAYAGEQPTARSRRNRKENTSRERGVDFQLELTRYFH